MVPLNAMEVILEGSFILKPREDAALLVCWLSLAKVTRSLADEGPSSLAGGGV